MSDYADWTESIELLGSEIMLPIDLQGSVIMVPFDIQGATIMMPIDIQGQTLNLQVDIVAQTIGSIAIDIAAQSIGNINVNIAASAVTMNVNIAASAVTINMDIKAQSVGVYLQPEWASRIGVDKTLTGSASINNGLFADLIDYTVPPGKTCYINLVGIGIYNFVSGSTFRFWGHLRDASLPKFDFGGEVGGVYILNRPAKYTAGQHVILRIGNVSTQQFLIEGTVAGYEIVE